MTIHDIKNLKLKVTNPQVLEAIEMAVKYKEIIRSLEVIKKIKIKKVQDKLFETKASKNKLKIEVNLLDEMIKKLGDE